MAKRFTDSRKWYDDWFLELPNEHKLLWIYLLDMCDHAGIFKPNIKLLNFCLNSDYTSDNLIKIFGDRLQLLKDGKVFIPKFISFQYGNLSSDSAFHRKVYSILKTHNIDIPYRQGIDTLKEEKMVLDKDNTTINNSIYTKDNTFRPKKVSVYHKPKEKPFTTEPPKEFKELVKKVKDGKTIVDKKGV